MIVDIKNVKNNSDIDLEGNCVYYIINIGSNCKDICYVLLCL